MAHQLGPGKKRRQFESVLVVIYLTQVTARYCGCKRPDSRGGVGRQVTGSQRKRLGRCPRAPAIVAGSGGRPTSPGHAYQAPRAFQGLGGATSLASRLQPVAVSYTNLRA